MYLDKQIIKDALRTINPPEQLKKTLMTIQTYSIKDLEDITGIKSHTLRAWERRYKIFKPSRTPTNIRFYSDEDLKKLLNISLLMNYGLKISQLSHFSCEELNEKVRSVFSSNDYESVIDGLILDMINFDEAGFEKKLNRVIFNSGFEAASYNVIYPFFKKVGILWQTNTINPAQEHFVTNIIKQKFFLASESLEPPRPNAKTFILFLLEKELHELALLLANYLVRKYGHRSIYLGQSIPMIDVIKTWHATKADFILTHITSLIDDQELASYLNELAGSIDGTPVLLSGLQINAIQDVTFKNVEYLGSPADLTEKLKNL